MKKLIVILLMLGWSLTILAQSTPVNDLRVATATTTFGINLPIGTKVYNIADGKYWVATAGVLGTATLTTASASFTQLNAPTDISSKKDKSDSIASDGYVRRDRLTSTEATKKDKSDSIATDGYVRRDRLTSVANTKADKNATLTLGSTSMALGSTTTTVAGLTSVTSTTFVGALTGNASTATTAGNVTGTVAVANGGTGATTLTGVVYGNGTSAMTAATGAQIASAIGTTAVTNATNATNATTATTAGNVTGTVAVANGGTGATTLTSGSYLVGNGTGAVALKTPAQVLSDIGAASTSSASLFKTESFEEATTGASGQINTLASTPKAATAIQVILNGTPLKSTQYTYTQATPSIQISIPVYQYDKVTISYGY